MDGRADGGTETAERPGMSRRRVTRPKSLFALSILLASTLLSSSVLSGCAKPAVAREQSPASSSSGPRRVVLDETTVARLGLRTHVVGETNFASTIAVSGSIELDPTRYAEVGPRLEGRVVSLHARLGDRVKKGDLLAVVAVPTLADAQASVLTSKAALEAARRNQEREEKLFLERLTTAREKELAVSELARAKAESSAAEARVLALGAAGGTFGSVRLTAPIDGVVVQRAAVLGGHLAASANAFAIADLGGMVAALEVHEADLPYLTLGTATRFIADGLPERTFQGVVTFIDPIVSKTSRTVRARLEVDNADGALRAGMFLRALLPVPAAVTGAAIRLPIEAVQPLGEHDVAFVEVAPGTYEVRALTLGRRTGEVVEVRAGLTRDERVVVEGAFLVRAEASKQ